MCWHAQGSSWLKQFQSLVTPTQMRTTEAGKPVGASMRQNASLATTKRPRVRKLLPMAPHHADKTPPPPPPSQSKHHVDLLGHLRAEVDRLQQLMGAAVAAKDLKQVEAVMEQLLTLLERDKAHESRGHKTSNHKDAKQFNDELLAYLDVCEVDLRALVHQEERERKHQRFAANALMQQATTLLHSGGDEMAVRDLLNQAEHAYRRARDKRADCIPAIRHRVAAEATLTQATLLFDAGDINASIALVQTASDEYDAFRISPTYQGSQILLSLSDPSDAWEEAPLRDLGHATHDDLDRCFANVDEFFRDKARIQTKSLVVESKMLAEQQRFAEAREALERCDAVYAWLAESVPLAVAKWKRQLVRLEIAGELLRLETAPQREITALLYKWALACDAGKIQREDLVECGVGRFVLQSITGISLGAEDPLARELAAAVFTLLLEHILSPGDSVSSRGSDLRSLADLKTVLTALLQLAELLESDQRRIRVLQELSSQLDSKQSTHVAIQKCDILTHWARLREAHTAVPDVLGALLGVLLRVIESAFPAMATILTQANVVRGVAATLTRHYKHVCVASVCVGIFTALCAAREHCVSALLVPGGTALTSAMVYTLRHHTQQTRPPTSEVRALVVGLISVIVTLSELELAFAKAVDAASIPSIVVSLRSDPQWGISAELAAFFEPRRFNRIRDGQLPMRASTRSLLAVSVPKSQDHCDVPSVMVRVCLVRFGASVQVARRRAFCVVRFLVPDGVAPRADQCQLEVTTLLRARVQTQCYGFPRDGVYSLAVLRRELTHVTPGRVDFFRALVASLPPVASSTHMVTTSNSAIKA